MDREKLNGVIIMAKVESLMHEKMQCGIEVTRFDALVKVVEEYTKGGIYDEQDIADCLTDYDKNIIGLSAENAGYDINRILEDIQDAEQYIPTEYL